MPVKIGPHLYFYHKKNNSKVRFHYKKSSEKNTKKNRELLS